MKNSNKLIVLILFFLIISACSSNDSSGPTLVEVSSNEEDVDFVIAFSGCKTYISNEECNILYEIYAKLAEQF